MIFAQFLFARILSADFSTDLGSVCLRDFFGPENTSNAAQELHCQNPRSNITCLLGAFWEKEVAKTKGPYRTKNTTETEFRCGEKIRYGRSKTLRRGVRNACFSRGKRQENGTESEKLRRQQNTTDSSAVLFLVQKGPLGGLKSEVETLANQRAF